MPSVLKNTMFGKTLEPVSYMQNVKVLVQGICSYLDGTSSTEEMEAVKKSLEQIDQELSASGQGLLDDREVHRLEDDLALVYNQLTTVVRAQSDFTKKETDVFLQFVKDYHLERQLTALYHRLMGVSPLTERPTLLEQLILSHKPKRWELSQFCVKVNFVLATGLLCLLTQASMTGRDQAFMMKTWTERMSALYRKMKTTGGRCLGYFLEQAEVDVREQLDQAVHDRVAPDVAAASILKALEKNYDWMHWAVMLHPAFTPLEEEGEKEEEEDRESQEETEESPVEKQPGQFLSVVSEPPVPHVVACYREAPTSLDKSRIHQLIVDLEWKIPNPPPEVYAAIEEDPGRARRYLASRMLQKLQEGLGSEVAVHVVPGRMEMKCNFPPASYYLYEYKHRLASGTVCVFG
ncbi:hypothetical protein WMY93_002982 [Mugilogobius chulae]|uniref:Uncharacterized protein n=1 Tax=Mugilogobius chulae TaxID=88201 RepID=A0AAW0PV76_9GOBI